MRKKLLAKSMLTTIGWIVFLAFFVTRVFLHSDFPTTHDGENHLARFANYKAAVREGQFPPRFAPNLMNHYGYPVFNFNYPLANILSLPFSFAKVSYELTFKILAATAIVSGLIGAWFWLKLLGFDLSSRRFGIGVFAASPYILQLFFFRGSIGEILALSLFPWLLLGIDTIAQKAKTPGLKFELILAFLLAAFFLSHNVTVLFGTPLLFTYGLLRFGKKTKMWSNFSIVLVLAGLLPLWFWLPALLEQKYTVINGAGISQGFLQHFPTLKQLLFSPLKSGFSYPGRIDSAAFSVGLLQFFVLVAATEVIGIKIWKKIPLHGKRTLLFCTGIAWILLVAQLQFSAMIWQLVPLANFIQFPWRLTLFLVVFLIPLAAFVYQQLGKWGKSCFVILLLLQLLTFTRVEAVSYFHKESVGYDNFPQSTTTANENLPQNFTYTEISDWSPAPTLLEGKGSINVYNWKGSYRNYELQLTEPSIVTEPTMNFPGWETRVKAVGVQSWLKLSYSNNEQIKGRLAYTLPAGQYQVQTRFTQRTWPRLIGNSASGLTLIAIALFGISQFRRKIINA